MGSSWSLLLCAARAADNVEVKLPTRNLPRRTRDSGSAEPPGELSRTAAYYAVIFSLGLFAASLGPTLPGLAARTGTRLGEIGFLFTARSLGTLLGSISGGRWYDRMRGHPLIGTVLVMMALMMALVPLSTRLWHLAAVVFLLGVAEGVLDVGANTLLVWTHRRRVGPYINGLHFFFGAGSFLAPLILARSLLWSGDIAWAYWALAALLLPVALGVARLPSPSPPGASGKSRYNAADPRLTALIALFFFLYVGAEVSFGGWIYTYAVAQNLGSAVTAAYLTSAFWGAFTLGRLLGIPLASRYRPGSILLVDLVGCLTSLAVIILWPQGRLPVWLGTLGLGLCMASIFPTVLALAERRMAITGGVTGWFFAGAGAGGMTLPWLVGHLFAAQGPPALAIILLVDLALALGIYSLLLRVRDPRAAEIFPELPGQCPTGGS